MRKILVFVMAVLSLACMCFAFACGQEEPTEEIYKVGQVSEITLESGTLKWKKAEDAESYKIEVYFNNELDSSNTMTTESFNQNVKKVFKQQGEYKFAITGVSGEDQGKPVYFTVNCIKLATPSVSLSEDGTKYVWNQIDNVVKYRITDTVTVDVEDITANYYNDVKTEDTDKTFFYPIYPGAHSVKVKAVGLLNGNTVYIESDASNELGGIEIEKYTFFTVGASSSVPVNAVIETGYGKDYAYKPIKVKYKAEDKWGNPVTGKGIWGRRFSVGWMVSNEYYLTQKGITCDGRHWTCGSLPTNDWYECYGRLDENGNITVFCVDFTENEYFAVKDVEVLDNLTVLAIKRNNLPSNDPDYYDTYGTTQTTAIETKFAPNSTVKVKVRFTEKIGASLVGEGPIDKEGNQTLRFYEIGGVRKNFTERADIEDKEQMPYTTDWVEITCELNDEGKLEVTWGGMYFYEFLLLRDICLAD